MTVNPTNPTAQEILDALVAADIPASAPNAEGVFDDPHLLPFTLSKGKTSVEIAIYLAQTEAGLWAAGISFLPEPDTLRLPKAEEAVETWEKALDVVLEGALTHLERQAPKVHKVVVPTLTELAALLRDEAAKPQEMKEHTDEQGRRWIPISKLKINPALNVVPMVSSVASQLMGSTTADGRAAGAEISAERDAFFASLDEQGILEDLKGHEEDDGTLLVDDGRHRLEWAIARGETHVPFKQLTREQGEALAEATVIGRRHWTKGQRAYLGVLLHPEVATGEKRGQHKKNKTEAILTHGELAERLGVSVDVVLQAVKLYTLFHAPGAKKGSAEEIEAADLKAKFEVSIWAGAGLGGVLAGIGGGISTKDKPKPASSFHGLEKPLATLSTLSKSWSKWDEAERSKAKKLITTRLKELDGDFRLALSEALAAAE